MAIALDEPTLLDNILYYGLFVGALFQLICIFSVVFIPQSENEDVSPYLPVNSHKFSQKLGQNLTKEIFSINNFKISTIITRLVAFFKY